MTNMAPFMIMVGSIIDMVITVYVASRPASEKQKWLLLTCTIASACNLLYYAELKETVLSTKCVFHNLVFMLKGFTGVSFFIFIYTYCDEQMNSGIRMLFCLISFIYGSVSGMNYTTSWLYTTNGMITGRNGVFLDLDYHAGYYIVVTTYIVMSLMCFVMLIKKLLRCEGQEFYKTRGVLILNLIPAIGFVVTMILHNEPTVDHLMLSFDIGILVITWMIAHYGLTDALQIAMIDLVEQSSEGLVVVDNDYRILYTNPIAEKLIDKYEENEGQKPEMKKLFAVSNSVHGYGGRDYEIRVSELHEGRVCVGFMAWILDMTYISKNTQQIIKLKQEAEAASVAKSQFLADMSHEIRTPMNAIIGFSELMIDETDPQVNHNYAQDIHSASQILLSLINKILDISRVESGKFEVKITTYNIRNIIESVGNVIGFAAEQKDLDYLVKIDESVPEFLDGSPEMVYEIMINILNNGVKYTQKGYVSLKVSYENGILNLEIKDSGQGMTEEYQKKIYDKFSRVESEENKKIEGTGLGMSIVKGLLKQLKGAIKIKSVMGEGTTFFVYIPQKECTEIKDSMIEVEDKKENRRFTLPDAKILVVDDNDLNLRVISSIFKTYKNQIDTASSGEESLEFMRNYKYDLVFMDQMMPGMDGVTAMQEARKIPEYATCPIVMLTANAINGVETDMIRKGFDGYLTKPIDKVKLSNILIDRLPARLIKYADEDILSEIKTSSIYRDDRTDIQENPAKKLNFKQGIENCGGSEEDYREILDFMCQSHESRKSEIQQMYQEENWEQYTINVHGLKSSTRSIGAVNLSDLAYQLEMAGKENRIDFIQANHSRLMEEFDQMNQEAEKFLSGPIEDGASLSREPEESASDTARESGLSSETSLEYISRADLAAIVENIYMKIMQFDLNAAEPVVEGLKIFDISQELRDALGHLKEALAECDYDKSKKCIQNVISKL